MTTNENDGYVRLTARTEQTIQELMDRAGELQLAQPQLQRHISMAHGALALWLRLVDELPAPSGPDHANRVQGDRQRLKALIRRPPAVAPKEPRAAQSNGYFGRTPPTQTSYGLHWHRVQRSVRGILAPSFGTRLNDEIDWHDTWEDVATSAFIHLHQLKDWFPEPVSKQANDYIDEHEPLQICADLANTAKHAWLNPERGGARASVIAQRGSPVIHIPLGRSVPGPGSRAKVEIRIEVKGKGATSHLLAVDLVRECFALWRQFIVDRVTTGELSNVEHGSVWINEGEHLRLKRPSDR